MDFPTLAYHARKNKGLPQIAGRHITLVFDPGHTTGYAVFEGYDLVRHGEIRTEPIEEAIANLTELYGQIDADTIVVENYRIYKWRAQHHAGSEVLTTRVIGVIETLSMQSNIWPIVKQPAHIAKGFCTNKKLKEWGYYKVAAKHANDAIRHGCYYLAFGAIEQKQKRGITVG